jgi:mono/diheme cytochrome c family protein
MKSRRPRTRLAFASIGWAALAVAAHAEAAPAAEQIEQGRIVYEDNCESCHGRNMNNPAPTAFDLRKFPRDNPAWFHGSVLNGKGTAMPAFQGRLSNEDLNLLWAYVQGRP